MIERTLNLYGLSSPLWLAVSVAAVIGALGLIVMLLRYERRLVTPRVGNTLLLLRIGVLVAVFATLLEPVVTWEVDQSRQGRVLVAVDLSESMNTSDRHASRAEKLRWSRALGMIGNSGNNARLDAYQAAFDRGEEPVWPAGHEAADKAMLEAAFASFDELSRKEVARRLLTATGSPLLEQLEEVADVELRVFAGRATTSDVETFSSYLDAPPDAISVMSSNLEEALKNASEGDGGDLAGIVLVTEGRDNSAGDPIQKAIQLRDREIPVYPVMIGSEQPPRDLAIVALDYPSKVYKGDHAVLKADFKTAGFEGRELTVVLDSEVGEPIVQRFTPTGRTHELEFALPADSVGRHRYRLHADVEPGETRDDNNARDFHVNVVNDRASVVLVDNEARWEFRFIDRALERDAQADVRSVLFRQPYLGVMTKPFFDRRLETAADGVGTPFDESDMVILGDVSEIDFPAVAWEELHEFVAKGGGTLVMVAGKQSFPRRHTNELLQAMLPVRNLRVRDETGASAKGSPGERGFHLRLSPEGERAAMLQFDADAGENRRIWSALPGHTWGLIGEAEPGATVFAHAGAAGNEANDLALERQNAVIVHKYFGFGQVLWIGIDSTWRWRHRTGDTYHHRFWGQLARWAADNKASSGNEFVKFGVDETDIESGQDVVLRARWTNAFLQRNPNLQARVEVFERTDGQLSVEPIATLPLESIETRPIIHEGLLASPRAGEYEARLIVENGDVGAEPITASFFVHGKQNAELSNLSSNRELLTRIAEASNGRLFLPDEVGELANMFVDAENRDKLREETSVWDHWLMLVVFFSLLTTEWIIRKLNGLP